MKRPRKKTPVLQVVKQSDYETVLRALRDFIRITEAPHQTYGTDECLRLAEIRGIARNARPRP